MKHSTNRILAVLFAVVALSSFVAFAQDYTCTLINGNQQTDMDKPDGEPVQITADIVEGKHFTNWTSDNTDVKFADSTKTQTTFTMPQSSCTVTAVYSDAPIELQFENEATVSTEHTVKIYDYIPKDALIGSISANLSDIAKSFTRSYTPDTNQDASVTIASREFENYTTGAFTFEVVTSNYGTYAFKVNLTLTGVYDVTLSAKKTYAYLYDGTPKTCVSNVKGVLHTGSDYTGDFTYTYKTSENTTLDSAPTEAGRYTVIVSVPESDDYRCKNPIEVEFEILSAPQASYQTEKNGEWKNGTIYEAFESVYDGGTVKLLANAELLAPIYVNKNMTVTSENGVTIKRGENLKGYMFDINADSTFENVTIDGNNREDVICALIAVSQNTFTLGNNASLVNNKNVTDKSWGGGVCVKGGKFVLDGGKIENCGAYYGGAIGIYGGECTAKSGYISKNKAKIGGAISALSPTTAIASLTLQSVNISDNSADYYAGGVLVHVSSNFSISGNPQFNNNTSSETNAGIYLNSNKKDGGGYNYAVATIGKLDENCKLSFYTWLAKELCETGASLLKPADGCSLDLSKLIYDGTYEFALNNSGEAYLQTAEYTVSFESNGGSGTMASQKTTNGGEYTLPECGFTAPFDKLSFDGWYMKKSDGTSEKVYSIDGKITLTESVTLYPAWVLNLAELEAFENDNMSWNGYENTDETYEFKIKGDYKLNANVILPETESSKKIVITLNGKSEFGGSFNLKNLDINGFSHAINLTVTGNGSLKCSSMEFSGCDGDTLTIDENITVNIPSYMFLGASGGANGKIYIKKGATLSIGNLAVLHNLEMEDNSYFEINGTASFYPAPNFILSDSAVIYISGDGKNATLYKEGGQYNTENFDVLKDFLPTDYKFKDDGNFTLYDDKDILVTGPITLAKEIYTVTTSVKLCRADGKTPIGSNLAKISITRGGSEVFAMTESTENNTQIINVEAKLSAGTYTLSVTKNGYVKYSYEFTVSDNTEIPQIVLIPGDIKSSYDESCGDGVVDIDDFIRVIRGFSNTLEEQYYNAVDINEDGAVTVADLALVKQYFGSSSLAYSK